MSIYFSGSWKRSSGVISAITKQLKLVNLKPVKKIQVQFDPFHPNAVTASEAQAFLSLGNYIKQSINSRDFLFHISTPKVTETNLNCIIRSNVVCDRSDPEIKIDLLDSGSIKFLATNLTVLEILQQFNKHISSKVKPEEVKAIPATKSEKKKLKKR